MPFSVEYSKWNAYTHNEFMMFDIAYCTIHLNSKPKTSLGIFIYSVGYVYLGAICCLFDRSELAQKKHKKWAYNYNHQPRQSTIVFHKRVQNNQYAANTYELRYDWQWQQTNCGRIKNQTWPIETKHENINSNKTLWNETSFCLNRINGEKISFKFPCNCLCCWHDTIFSGAKI